MSLDNFVKIAVLTILIFIGIWAYSIQQAFWESKQPSLTIVHVGGELVTVNHWNNGELDISVTEKEK